jgi:hypothetical protein
MPYRFAVSTSGPLAKIAESLAFPAALQLNSLEPHHAWALVDKEKPIGQEGAWALFPAAAAIAKEHFQPRFDSVEEWLPGMTVLLERRLNIRVSAAAEVSALWTSLAAPVHAQIAGDIGLDLDLGIQTKADVQVYSDCWWSIERPSEKPVLRVRLCAARGSARSISVKAVAAAGLDQATRNTIAALLGRHRTQVLHQLQAGAKDVLAKFPAPKRKLREFLDTWLALPAEEQAAQWRNPVDPLLAKLKAAVDTAVDTTLAGADQLTARLEFAALRAIERKAEISLSARFDKYRSSTALLDAEFDFAANPALDALFRQTLDGNFTALFDGPVAGTTIHSCAVTGDLTRRQTFAWRIPFASGLVSTAKRLHTAMEALDDATGRIVRAHVAAESERRTRHAASLLSIEGAFAARLSPGVTVHDPASLSARFALDIRTNRPRSLQPLLNLYGAGLAQPDATRCRLEMTIGPEAVAHWLEPQVAADVSRRMQRVWRTLLPLVVDIDALDAQSAAPLLVWASLPVSAGARLNGDKLELNRGSACYWDWPDRQLRDAMVWNPLTREALVALLGQTHLDATADEIRRVLSKPPGSAVFESLLYTEASFIDRLTSALQRWPGRERNPAKRLRELSLLLAGLVSVFHSKLTSVYGADAARALGPLLLSSASAQKPEVTVSWSR